MSRPQRGRFDDARRVVPDFGRMLHLPYDPNTDRDDLVASLAEADVIFRSPRVLIEEKLDGSQVAVASAGDGSAPWIRSKNHVLVKGYGRKGTNAKAQYAPLWNWVYEHAAEFAAPTALLGEVVGVYGEWLYAEHTLCYDLAPDDFIAYQIYRPSLGDFLDPLLARSALVEAGFSVPPLLGSAELPTDYAQLASLAREPSPASSRDRREGIVVKVGDGERLVCQKEVSLGDTGGVLLRVRDVRGPAVLLPELDDGTGDSGVHGGGSPGAGAAVGGARLHPLRGARARPPARRRGAARSPVSCLRAAVDPREVGLRAEKARPGRGYRETHSCPACGTVQYAIDRSQALVN